MDNGINDDSVGTSINVVGIQQRMEDPEFLQEILEVFKESYPHNMAALNEAIDAKDYSSIERYAHSLKGELMNFFSGRVVALAYKIELLGRNASSEDLVELHAAFKKEMDELAPLIEEMAALDW